MKQKHAKDLMSFLSELLHNKKHGIAKQKSTSVVSPQNESSVLIDNNSISKQKSHDILKPILKKPKYPEEQKCK